MRVTKLRAFKRKCYWDVGDNGWYLADYTGVVYEDIYGMWLKTPSGFTKVTLKDLRNNHAT